MQTTQLLHTKLQRPQVPSHFVPRPRLTQRLDHGAQGPLTLVCAAAGFDKTTLVSSWLASLAEAGAHSAVPAAWLSLDESDSDLTAFLRYLIAALRTMFPHACADTLELLLAQKAVPQSVLFPTFVNELMLFTEEVRAGAG
jgi:LuxR family transcriptional regulator, maltose regulon positive regulatory protein